MSHNHLIDFNDPLLWLSVTTICFNPLLWNVVARIEYKHKTLTEVFGGNNYLACYAFGAVIFTLGIIRDAIYEQALSQQPSHALLLTPLSKLLAIPLFAIGGTFVATSMYALGVTGTYLGDYFGILLDKMITGFPFNATSCPMYNGSTMLFLATSLWKGKPAGLFLTSVVYVVYKIALSFEDPFTAKIYAKRARDQKSSKSKSR